MRSMTKRLTLDRYAEIRAEMEAGVLRDDALARAGLSVDEWTAAQHEWLESMSTEIALGRFELTNRYAQAFLERQRALVKPAPKAPAEKPAKAPDEPPKGRAQGESLLEGTTDVDTSLFRPALPFDAKPDARSPLASASAPRPSTSSDAAAWVPKGLRGVTDLDETAPLPSTSPLPTMPFSDAGSKPAPAPAPAPAPPQAIPAGMREFTEVESTQAPLPGAANAPVLPFDPPASPSLESPPQAKAADAPAWMPKAMRGFLDVEGTETLPRAPATPAPAAPPAVTPPRLTLEQHARLSVELAAYPTHRAEVLRRYSIDEEQGRQVEAFWSAHMKADANVRRAWEGYCATHQTWLRGAHGARR
jgi:hypothetical protein